MTARWVMFAAGLFGLPACVQASDSVSCDRMEWKSTPVTICEISPSADIRLHLTTRDGSPIRDFKRLHGELSSKERLAFAMNAGMYHADRSPVGLYIEDGIKVKSLVTSKGPGNFHLLPNGVFWVDDDGRAHVMETTAYETEVRAPRFATQSGPMLVIDGALHPKFIAGGTSRKIRNGIGVADDRTYAVMSDAPINFHDFATLFRDFLETPNALYLDGTISRMHIEGGRSDRGLAMGPILSVVDAPSP